jgi:DNA-binding NtrC family response regulator
MAGMAVILVVNDDADMLDTYEAFLREMGHQPVTKISVASGPETVREIKPDALVVDLQLADEKQHGLRIIEEVRGDPELGALPIVLCTGAAAEVGPLTSRLRALDVPVVLKPFKADHLEETLTRALERRRASPDSHR